MPTPAVAARNSVATMPGMSATVVTLLGVRRRAMPAPCRARALLGIAWNINAGHIEETQSRISRAARQLFHYIHSLNGAARLSL